MAAAAIALAVAAGGGARADVSLESMSGADAGPDSQAPAFAPPPEPPPVEAFTVIVPEAPPLSPAERLLADRCTACHPAANYQDKHYSSLRWWLVILRMEHVNGAVLADGERVAIIAKLTADRPATSADILAEAATAGAIVGAVLLLGRVLARRFPGRRRRPNTASRNFGIMSRSADRRPNRRP